MKEYLLGLSENLVASLVLGLPALLHLRKRVTRVNSNINDLHEKIDNASIG